MVLQIYLIIWFKLLLATICKMSLFPHTWKRYFWCIPGTPMVPRNSFILLHHLPTAICPCTAATLTTYYPWLGLPDIPSLWANSQTVLHPLHSAAPDFSVLGQSQCATCQRLQGLSMMMVQSMPVHSKEINMLILSYRCYGSSTHENAPSYSKTLLIVERARHF